MLRLTALFLSVLLAACAGPMASRQVTAPEPVTVGIIAINDFHGALEPPGLSVQAPDGKGGVVSVPAGGAAWLASAIDQIRAEYPYSVVVSAGDLISASQFASSIYLDEPTIGVMNRIGLDFNAVGNHEFDRGRKELLRMQNGGCEQHTMREPCRIERFKGANFRFLSASTVTETGKTLFPSTGLKSFGTGADKVTVGFIGLTLKGTPELVIPERIEGLTFIDEADAINAAVPKLKQAGADAIVVLIHQGAWSKGDPDPNGCGMLAGGILPILARLDSRVDVVVSGHTHQAYVCDFAPDGRAKPLLLTSAGVFGEVVTDIRLAIDPAGNRVVSRRAHNVIVQSRSYPAGDGERTTTPLYPQFEPRADIAAYTQRYVDAAREFAHRPAGQLAGPALKPGPTGSRIGGTLGNLIADAHLAATSASGAQIAFTNPTGIRATLVPDANGKLTFGQLFAAQPFGNTLVTQSMSGAELKTVLEECLDEKGTDQLLAPSAGFSYSYDISRPIGERIAGMALNGRPIEPDAIYRVTTNSFLAAGGDGFSGFAAQRDAVTGMIDIEALEAWLQASPARAVPTDERVIAVAR